MPYPNPAADKVLPPATMFRMTTLAQRATYRIAPVALLLACALAVVTSAPLQSQIDNSSWRIGLARVKITPENPIRMAGYASRTKPFEGVDAHLFAKAMAFEDSDGNQSLLITADMIRFPGWLSEAVCRRLKESAGIERNAVLLNASHTHTGPALDPARYDAPADDINDSQAYARKLEDKLVAIGRQALADLKPARLGWDTGLVNFPMNRREFTERGVRLGVNPRGPVDRGVPVLRVDGAGGELRAVLFGTACHNTTLTGRSLRISGDFTGYAQAYIEHRYPGVQAMFLTGCGGDANPYPRGNRGFAEQHGAELGGEVVRVLAGQLKSVRGPIRTELARVDLPLKSFTRAQIEEVVNARSSYLSYFAKSALAVLDRAEPLPTTFEAPFAVWQFGDSLTLVGFSQETVVGYVDMTETALGPLNLWVAGYCNDVSGYLPTTRILSEGGYETRGLYDGVGVFAPGVEDVVMKTITNLARKAGREIPEK